mgnify:CR=1 FL=1
MKARHLARTRRLVDLRTAPAVVMLPTNALRHLPLRFAGATELIVFLVDLGSPALWARVSTTYAARPIVRGVVKTDNV